MRTPQLEARHHAAAIVSQMLLICFREMLGGYNRQGKNVAAILPEILTIMAIKVNDDLHQPPMSANEIAKAINLPRVNVQRGIAELIAQGVIEKRERGYVATDDYMMPRMDAPYFQRIVSAIRSAARELESFR